MKYTTEKKQEAKEEREQAREERRSVLQSGGRDRAEEPCEVLAGRAGRGDNSIIWKKESFSLEAEKKLLTGHIHILSIHRGIFWPVFVS